MIRFAPVLSLLGLLVLSTGFGRCQTISLPYNPDSEPDGIIGASDIVSTLGLYGESFSPGEILVDSVALTAVLNGLTNAIDSLNNVTSSLESQNSNLQAAMVNLENSLFQLQSNFYSVTADLEGQVLYWAVNKDATSGWGNTAMPNGDWASGKLSGVAMNNTDLSGAIFDHADLTNATLNNTAFQLVTVDFSHSSFRNADLTNAIIENCDFTGADFTGADLTLTNFSSSIIADANMTCLRGCPTALPAGYICTNDPTCIPGRFHVTTP